MTSIVPSADELEKMTVVQLRELLKQRNLSMAGTKAVLVQRLAESIADEELLRSTSDVSGIGAGGGGGSGAGDLSDAALLGLEEPIVKKPAAPSVTSTNGSAASGKAEPEKSTDAAAADGKSENTEDKSKKTTSTAVLARLGVPLSGTPAAEKIKKSAAVSATEEEERKRKRAERFGVTVEASPATQSERLVARAKRFGSSTNGASTASATSEEERARLLKRAERFGLPVNATASAPAAGASEEELEKLKQRAARFGISSNVDADVELKKKARLDRFK